jgi:hypothetical protein
LVDLTHVVVRRRTREAHVEMAWYLASTATEAHSHFPFLLECTDRCIERLGCVSMHPTNEQRHHNGSRKITIEFSKYISKKQLDRIMRSPYISVAIDESTDISVTSNMVIYIYFIEDGEVQVEFFTLVDLKGASAKDIEEALVTALKEAGLLEKVIVLGSDGCSVMLGKDNGVGALLRRRPEGVLNFMLQFHCAAHKLMLSSGDAFSGEYCVEVDRMISCIHRLFKQSPKNLLELEQIYKEFAAAQTPEAQLRLRMIKRHVVTRWLSRHGAIASIVDHGTFDAVFKFVQTKDDDENADQEDYEVETTATGRKAAMKLPELAASLLDFERVGMMFFLADITGPLNMLSLVLQKTVPDLKEVLDTIDGLSGGIKKSFPPVGAMSHGPRVTRLLERVADLGSDNPGDITIGEHTIKVTKEKRDAL